MEEFWVRPASPWEAFSEASLVPQALETPGGANRAARVPPKETLAPPPSSPPLSSSLLSSSDRPLAHARAPGVLATRTKTPRSWTVLAPPRENASWPRLAAPPLGLLRLCASLPFPSSSSGLAAAPWPGRRAPQGPKALPPLRPFLYLFLSLFLSLFPFLFLSWRRSAPSAPWLQARSG